MVMENTLKKGDYVLATKYSDGDPQDAWCVGFFDSMLRDRYIIVDGEGKPFRANGYRAARIITKEEGEFLIQNKLWIESSMRSVWHWIDDSDEVWAYDEPHYSGGNAHITMTKKQAIAWMRKIYREDYSYKKPSITDEEVFKEWLAVNFAYEEKSK